MGFRYNEKIDNERNQNDQWIVKLEVWRGPNPYCAFVSMLLKWCRLQKMACMSSDCYDILSVAVYLSFHMISNVLTNKITFMQMNALSRTSWAFEN